LARLIFISERAAHRARAGLATSPARPIVDCGWGASVLPFQALTMPAFRMSDRRGIIAPHRFSEDRRVGPEPTRDGRRPGFGHSRPKFVVLTSAFAGEGG
jgi:hypothetical protein